jgi:anti-sigma factor RsiW
MNNDFKLKLQSLIDGELSRREARELEARLVADPAGQALRAELEMTRQALRGNELERLLPLPRELYWKPIERGIEAEERAPARRPASSLMDWLMRYWPQLSGAAVAACLLGLVAVQLRGLRGEVWDDIENPLTETGSFSFRSEQQRMTLVWVSNGDTGGGEASDGSVN